MEYELKQYIRNEFNQPMGVMVATVNEENPMYVHIGVSLCHAHDKFDKTFGYKLAKSRIKNPNSWYKLKKFYRSHFVAKYKYKDDTDIVINNFIDRCFIYFKNKMIVMPKIIFF